MEKNGDGFGVSRHRKSGHTVSNKHFTGKKGGKFKKRKRKSSKKQRRRNRGTHVNKYKYNQNN